MNLKTMERFKLSDIQKRKLFTFKSELPKSSIKFWMPDAVDLNQFHDALIQIVKHHKILRAELVEVPEFEQPLQQITALSLSHEQGVVDTSIQIGNISYFAKHKGSQYEIELTAPSIFFDSVSFSILLDAVFRVGKSTENEFDYIQFATWQNKYLKSLTSGQKAFWSEREALKKLFCKPIQSRSSNSSKTHFRNSVFTNTEEINKNIRSISKKTGYKEEEILLACWLILLYKNSQKEKLTLGLYDDGRFFEELDTIIGPFENHLPISISFYDAIKFKEVIQAIHKEFSLLEEHIDTFYGNTPYEKDNYFEAGYRYHSLDNSNINIREIHIPDFSSNILLDIFRSGDATRYSFQYNAKCYSEKSVEILKKQLAVVIEEALHKTEIPVKKWSTTNSGLSNLVYGFHQPIQPEYKESVPDVFQKIVAKHSDALALVDHTEQITYKELYDRVRQLAVHIQKSEGERIALLLNPDRYTPITMLAVLFSGKSYVPIATDTPKRRLHFILKNAAIQTIITQKENRQNAPNMSYNFIFIDEIHTQNTDEYEERLIDSQSAAYHIYTSGTTGFPKGVSIPHKALVNYTRWMADEFKIGRGDRSALLTSYAFDLGYTALWGTLLNGATLYIPKKEISDDAKDVLSYIEKHQLTFLKATPSLLNVWVETDPRALFQCNHLRYIFSGGEAFDTQTLKNLARARPDICFVNHYGPTETTIGCIAKKIKANELTKFEQHPVIGKPISNMQAIILDENLQIIPPGIEGQLYITGHGLANTYLKQRALWEERCKKIIPSSRANWYDTGDRAIWTEEGRNYIRRPKRYTVKSSGTQNRVERDRIGFRKTSLSFQSSRFSGCLS